MTRLYAAPRVYLKSNFLSALPFLQRWHWSNGGPDYHGDSAVSNGERSAGVPSRYCQDHERSESHDDTNTRKLTHPISSAAVLVESPIMFFFSLHRQSQYRFVCEAIMKVFEKGLFKPQKAVFYQQREKLSDEKEEEEKKEQQKAGEGGDEAEEEVAAVELLQGGLDEEDDDDDEEVEVLDVGEVTEEEEEEPSVASATSVTSETSANPEPDPEPDPDPDPDSEAAPPDV